MKIMDSKYSSMEQVFLLKWNNILCYSASEIFFLIFKNKKPIHLVLQVPKQGEYTNLARNIVDNCLDQG